VRAFRLASPHHLRAALCERALTEGKSARLYLLRPGGVDDDLSVIPVTRAVAFVCCGSVRDGRLFIERELGSSTLAPAERALLIPAPAAWPDEDASDESVAV